MRVLECSSKGDRRFSAFYAMIPLAGTYDSIENHYQLSKRNGDVKPNNWKELKGKPITHFEIDGISIPLKYEEALYNLMWLIYLDMCPTLVKFASKFDDYTDMFRRNNGVVCQADAIREYVKKGRNYMLDKYKDFILFSKEKGIKDFVKL